MTEEIVASKWMQKARESMERRGTVGSLHRAAGVDEDKKIPEHKLSALAARAKSTGNTALAKKVQFAKNAP